MSDYVITPAPMKRATWLDINGSTAYLKLENLQETGSFKVHGAFLALTALQESPSIISASSGNFGIAVAWAAEKFGVKCIIFVPENTPERKGQKIEDYGATVIVKGKDYDEAERHARSLAELTGLPFLHTADPLVCMGNGQIGAEIAGGNFPIDIIVAPIGGGSLMVGMMDELKDTHIQFVGVQARRYNWLNTDEWVSSSVVGGKTLAGGIAVKEEQPTKERLQDLDLYLQIDEEDIKYAMDALIEHEGLMTEGAGAISTIANRGYNDRNRFNEKFSDFVKDKTVVYLITGRNISFHDFVDAVL